MSNAEYTSGYWLNTDGYKKLDKTQQANIQKDFVTMNNNQKAGKFNGAGAHNIASKYGLYTAPSAGSQIANIEKGYADKRNQITSGYFEDKNNYNTLAGDEKYAYDLYKKTGDLTRWQYKPTGDSPYDDLYKLFGVEGVNLGNEGIPDAWNRQSNNFKAGTMAGQAMGYTPQYAQQQYNQNGSYGGSGGAGGGGGGTFDEFLKMFMAMMMGGQGSSSGKPTQMGNANQFGDGRYLFNDFQHKQGENK